MQDNFDEGMQVEVLAQSLRMGKAESKELIETLATRLQAVMPDQTTVQRGGWMLSSVKPVRELTVRFDDCHLQLLQEKTGSVQANVLKVVRGVVLKTTATGLDAWIKLLATELNKAAESNAQTRQALNQFFLG
jgi:hypothetical protein